MVEKLRSISLYYLAFIATSQLLWGQNELKIGGIINAYAKVTSFDACKKTITVLNATGFKSGDKALLIQMQGAVADESQSSTFGTITDYKNTGNFEFVRIKSIRSTEIEFENAPLFDYNVDGNVQLVSVPTYGRTVYPDGTLTARGWDGSTGGVLVFETTGALDLRDGGIDVSGKGFRGGVVTIGVNIIRGVSTYYNSAKNPDNGGAKGEGIIRSILDKENGRGALGNAGGGGNGHNAGGGGGGNGGAGGNGGVEQNPSDNPLSNGGIGGMIPNWKKHTPNDMRIFMGGGGGAGQCNNGVGTSGGNGGGIIIIRAKNIVGRNGFIKSNGNSQTTVAGNDGGGGGGAGGSVFLDFDRILSSFTVEVLGGDGGNVNMKNDDHGTGGGGGGGIVYIADVTAQNDVTVKSNGGLNGKMVGSGSTTMAMPGTNGQIAFGYRIPMSTNPALSVDGSGDRIICRGSSIVLGNDATGGRPPYQYQWSPSATLNDPKIARPTATPTDPTKYTVVVTDAAGCTITKSMSINLFSPPDLEVDSTVLICKGESKQLKAVGTGKFVWSPNDDLQFPDSSSPIITPLSSRTYYVQITDVNGCKKIDSIYVEVSEKPLLSLQDTVFFCSGKEIELIPQSENGKSPFLYKWTSSETILTPNNRSLRFVPNKSARYYLTITDTLGCSSTDSTEVVMFSSAQADAGNNQTMCIGDSVKLIGMGGMKYEWTPNEDISDPTNSNPTVYPNESRMYYLKVENPNGCIAYDSVLITVLPLPEKPTIVRKTDTLFAESVSTRKSIVWKRNGVAITNDSVRIIADVSGEYTVVVTDQNGCVSESQPLLFTIGKADFCLNTIRGRVGETISIPLFLCNTESLPQSEADSIEAMVSFNKTTLLPKGFYKENKIVGNRRFLRVVGRVPENSTSPFAIISATVLLGNDTTTFIDISNGVSYGGKIQLNKGGGVFITEGVCIEGGLRLWQDGDITEIRSVNSNGNQTSVSYTLSSSEDHSITVHNSLGVIIDSFEKLHGKVGDCIFDFNNSGLSSGTYYLTIRTPTEYTSKSFVLIR